MRGQEFIKIKNTRGSKYEPISLFRESFSNRIADAVEAVREGVGDFIMCSSLFGPHMSVVRLLNRELGEKVRAEVIKGFEDAEFITTIKVTFNSESFFAPSFTIGENDALINRYFGDTSPSRAFESEDAAHEYIEDLEARIKAKVESIANWEEFEEWFRKEYLYKYHSMLEEGIYKTYPEKNKDVSYPPYSFNIIQELVK